MTTPQTKIKVGDKFLNPGTKTTNTVIKIEENHYYHGDGHYGPFYTLRIEELHKTINLTPALIRRFTPIP